MRHVINKDNVIFCEIAWMDCYEGFSEEYPSVGTERFNFLSYNHYCYGYSNSRCSIAEMDVLDTRSDDDLQADDVTVVWLASRTGNMVIVGWYEHATIHRHPQLAELMYDGPRYYNAKALATDCFSISPDKRTYVVGENPNVLKISRYLRRVRRKSRVANSPKVYRKVAKDEGLSEQELLDKAEDLFDRDVILPAFELMNLAVKKSDCFETRLRRAEMFKEMAMFDEYEEDALKALEFHKDADLLEDLFWVKYYNAKYPEAREYVEQLIPLRHQLDPSKWVITAGFIAYNYEYLYDHEGLRRFLAELESDPMEGMDNLIKYGYEQVEVIKMEEAFL